MWGRGGNQQREEAIRGESERREQEPFRWSSGAWPKTSTSAFFSLKPPDLSPPPPFSNSTHTTNNKNSAYALTPSSNSAASPNFAALIPGNSPAEIVFTSGISSFLSLYNAAIIGRLLLSWWPQAPQAIVSPLATLTDPYLGLFRGLIPPLGGTIDLSPILAFVTLDLLTSSAAALPCEMPTDGDSNGKAKAKKTLVPRRIPPRAGGSRWGVPSLVGVAAAAKQRRGRRSEQ